MGTPIEIGLNPQSIEDYLRFLDCKRLPRYEVVGRKIITDDISYHAIFGGGINGPVLKVVNNRLFDYQPRVANIALDRRRFAAFLDCGLGKTAITLHWAQEVCKIGKVLLLCPLSVINEFFADAKKFGISVPITNLRKTNGIWNEGIGILNYESMRDIDMRGVAGVALDESSILKNGEGATKKWLCDLVKNVEYRLAASATPAPNEQAEYASHAVFLGISNTNLEFYSSFFRKDGNDWVLKAHAVDPFYQYLSSFACYIANPMDMGFECGGYLDEEPEYIEQHIPGYETSKNGILLASSAGLADSAPVFRYRSQTGTPRFGFVVEKSSEYKSILWCKRNEEEREFLKAIPNSTLITGSTPPEKRADLIDAWKAGDINCLISKPEILGWGVNLQQAEAVVYSGYDHSFEKFYQAIRRAHRYGRNGRLKVFIPITGAEAPIFDVLKEKIKTFKSDVSELQKKFAI